MLSCHTLRISNIRSHCQNLARLRVLSLSTFVTQVRTARNNSLSSSSSSSSSSYTHPGRTVRTSDISRTVVVVFTAGSLLGASYLLRQPSNTFQDSNSESQTLAQDKYQYGMVGTVLPGRPGNLTPEQEVKLQEFWTVTLKVFGVSESNGVTNGTDSPKDSSASQVSADQRSRAGTTTSEKKKKKRNLFSRKQYDDGGTDEVQTDIVVDPDDKYGHTKNFQQVIANSAPEDLRLAFWSMVKHDHPDGLLLRFLRARKWDVQKALVMLIATMHWRLQEMHVDDDIVKRGEAGAISDGSNSNATVRRDGDDFMAQLRMGKSFLHGTDREGRPMCFVRVRLHKQGEQSEASLERYTVYFIETTRLLLASNVDTAAVVFDMTGFSMANMDYGPVKFMIKCFEANYPESLGVVLVHKSPWIFQGIWNIIKGWLDPVVASKVHFTKNTEELETYIPRSHIIKELGGDDPWTYTYTEPAPNESILLSSDEAHKQQLQNERTAVIQDFERATQEWTLGRGNGERMKQKRTELAEKLREGYWQLDPYIRAKTLYDRTGVIKEGGSINFYNSSGNVISPGAPTTTGTPTMTNGPLPAAQRADDLD